MYQISQLRRHGLFDAKVPRYTSYPPATRFSSKVTGSTYLDWLGALAPGSEVSLYLHIPFCRRLCWFCACRTQGVRSDLPVISYVQTLIAEMSLVAKSLPRDVRVTRVHWGGGTPTLLSAVLIAELKAALDNAFPIAEDCAFSVEIDPNEIDAERLDALIAAGMTRASIGVQDFDPRIQEIIGREQSFEVTYSAVEALRAAGIPSLNADILYGLPSQGDMQISDTAQMLVSLNPDRIALYGYAHVPWMARRQGMIPTDLLPRPEERLQLFETARRVFLWDGYQEIGIDHFARPEDSLARAARSGHLRRNFQGYTDDRCAALIGLGASAISRLPQGFAQNDAGTAAYQRAVRSGEVATARGHGFRGDDLVRGRVIEAILCDFAVDVPAIAAETGAKSRTISDLLRPVEAAFPDMVESSADRFAIRPEARPLARVIARQIDAYEMEAQGHSPAF